MWTKITNLVARIFTFFSGRDTKETWIHLELRQRHNLENLEALKKLRIKNF